MKKYINSQTLILLMRLYVSCVLCACSNCEQARYRGDESGIPHEQMLIPMSPMFSIHTVNDTLYKENLHIWKKGDFPLIGLLKIDGQVFRFMGGDSLRVKPLVPLALSDENSWEGCYTFLYPSKDWVGSDYNDSNWRKGGAPFGSEENVYPIHTYWSMYDIYVRRRFEICDKGHLENRQLYLQYVCDDYMKLYLNGDSIFQENSFLSRPVCCSIDIGDKLKEGENILAAHSRNRGGRALLDFGLYIADTTYVGAKTAHQKSVDIYVTQIDYVFQCGPIELQLNFVSPSLFQCPDLMGCPAGFLSYQVKSIDDSLHNIEIIFDLDIEGMYGGRVEVKDSIAEKWRIEQIDNLYIGFSKEARYEYVEGHLRCSQVLDAKSCRNNVLLLGYDEPTSLQYYGEDLNFYWNREGNLTIMELLMRIGRKWHELEEQCDKTKEGYVENIVACSIRNYFATHRLFSTTNYELICAGDTIGQVKDVYEYYPELLLLGYTDLIKGMLKPVFDCCEKGYWTKEYPPNDVGSYPIAYLQKHEKDDAGIENIPEIMMIMVAIMEKENDFMYVKEHWKLLKNWAESLKAFTVLEKPQSFTSEKQNLGHGKEILGLIAYQKLLKGLDTLK